MNELYQQNSPYANIAPAVVQPEQSDPPPVKTGYETKEKVVALLSFVLGYLFVRFFIFSSPLGFGATAFAVCFALVAVIFFVRANKPFDRKTILFLSVGMLFSTPHALFSSGVLLFPAAVCSFLFTVLWIARVCGFDSRFVFKDIFRAAFITPFRSFGKGFSALGQFFFRRSKAQKAVLSILLGLAITLPLTAIIALLLTSADELFATVFDRIKAVFSTVFFSNIFELTVHLTITVPVFLYIFGLLDGHYRTPSVQSAATDQPHNGLLYRFSPLTFCVIVTPPLLLYILFVCVQAPYYFSAFSSYLPPEYTVASFARRGFFELCAVACINLLLTAGLHFLTRRREDGKPHIAVRIYNILMISFTLVLLATAFRKMLLYIDSFGLTRLRTLTCWFMLLIAACFILLLLAQIFTKLHLRAATVAVVVVFIGILSFCNMDCIIARYNVYAYQSGKLETIDVDHFYDLSADAAAYAVPLLDDEDPAIRSQAATYIHSKKQYLNQLDPYEFSASSLYAKYVLDHVHFK